MERIRIMLPVVIFLLVVNCYAQTEPTSQKSRPNIIFILTDDQRYDAMGYAGNDIIQTPEMDRLADEGAYFKNAFVTTPICAASRASIMTGLYERSHRFTFGTPPLGKDLVDISYPKLLKDAGYSTGFIGKLGMHYENKMDTSLFDFYERPGEQFWATTYYRLNSDHSTHKHLSTEIGDLSLEFIEKYHADRPFCLSISFHAPHAEDIDPRQYIYPIELDSLYQNIDIPLPIMSDDKHFQAQPEFVREGLNRIRWYWRFDNPEKYQQMVKGYYRMISGVDREIGRIRQKLKAMNIADNTIIIFMGDNGYFLGERQFAGKWLMYENSLKVPLMIYDPDGANIKSEEMALNIDIAPTILSYAGIKIPEKMEGKDLRPHIKGEELNIRDEFLCEHLFDHKKIPRSEGIRSKRYKYFRYIDHPGYEEFYDLLLDPEERTNLINSAEYKERVDQYRIKTNQLIDTL